MVKTPEELYLERERRVEDAVQLKVPDRVPFLPVINLLAIKYTGITAAQAFYDYDLWFEASRKAILDLEPDIYWPATAAYPGRSFDAMQPRQLRWPGGGGAPDNSGIQFLEGECMKGDEYDWFLDDPTDYIIRGFLPRVFGALEALRDLPSLKSLFYVGYRGAMTSAVFARPEFVKVFEALYTAAQESAAYSEKAAAFDRQMKELGFPSAFGGASTWVPYDVFADAHRGMRGVMKDLFRQPDKLLAATEKILPVVIEAALASARRSGSKRVFIPLHWGADGFMSDSQFATFYWPGLKAVMLSIIEEGLTPCPLFEGNYDSRLKYLAEMPRGKVLGLFDKIDLRKAKEILGDIMCIAGGMPGGLLQVGTADDIRETTRNAIGTAGKGGGFIMASSMTLDDAKPELVKIWAECTREHGRY